LRPSKWLGKVNIEESEKKRRKEDLQPWKLALPRVKAVTLVLGPEIK
jgi:hypothetical protein